jgi:cation transport regulator ChaB
MPYATKDDLPAAIRHLLSPGIQHSFLEAFRVAWSAVEKRYEKAGQAWVRRLVRRAVAPARATRIRS